ncbi:MAG: helix-turn-helix domain-containing protein [Candidatus Hodarchaeota archaeon]
MTKKIFRKHSKKKSPEGPIEAGKTLGMTPTEILKKYLVKRNNILKLLRAYFGISLSEIAKKLYISEDELEKIENSENLVPFQLVPKFAKIFNVDLATLLLFLGHKKEAPKEGRENGFRQLALATQYSGPELTEQEKIDLEECFKAILDKIKTTSKTKS